MKLPKYCTLIGKSLYFQRRYPTPIRQHPNVDGKANYKVRLKSKPNDPVGLAQELDAHNKSFNEYLDTLSSANSHILDTLSLQKRAEAYLRVNGLEKGMLTVSDEYGNDALKQAVLEQGKFDEVQQHNWLAEHDKSTPIRPEPTQLVKVQELAWRMLNTPISEQPSALLLSDCWALYCERKGIKERNKVNNRSHRTWERFISINGGDTVVTQDVIDRYMDEFVKRRESEVSLSTVDRELNRIVAALRLANSKKRLKLNLSKPTLSGKHTAKAKPPLNHSQQEELLKLISDKSHSLYKPWKELFILISIQSGAHASELVSLASSDLHLNTDVPYITLNYGDGKGKTSDRARYVPLVLQVERIDELLNSGALEDLKSKTTDNISNQLKKLISIVDEKATAYSLRHTLKYNCDVAGIDSAVIASIGGWSGKSENLSQHMLGYGRESRETTERLRALQSKQIQALRHLLADEQTGDVIQINKRSAKSSR